MAARALMVSLVIVSLAIVPAMSMEYMVGGGNMWTLDIDYVEWAKDKTFYVGDKLVFMYNKEAHNVIKVNGTQFNGCVAPDPSNGAVLSSGYDVITLATPGKKWYICGFGRHCSDHKMKLVIDVLPQVATPAPAPSPSSAGGIAPKFCAWLISGAVSIIMMIKA
ncbi:hypothetical protein LIER_41212 [Lithospermum erythrorhizon]|uniref:Phytocyanin domain-containing protein n=1 Tax=Lithospermum erythrorhizon TaxID=34254 RepID=A0AAV3R7A1_LITER